MTLGEGVNLAIKVFGFEFWLKMISQIVWPSLVWRVGGWGKIESKLTVAYTATMQQLARHGGGGGRGARTTPRRRQPQKLLMASRRRFLSTNCSKKFQ